MKINETGRVGNINPYQRNIDNRDNQVSNKKRQTDQVSISLEAKEMLDAQNKVNEPARTARIQELKEAVSTGTYHVEANKLAEKLMPYFKSYGKSGDTE